MKKNYSLILKNVGSLHEYQVTPEALDPDPDLVCWPGTIDQGPKFWNDLRGGKTNFLYFCASATKSFAMLRIFKYGLTKDILSKGQKTKRPPPMGCGVKAGLFKIFDFFLKISII